MFLLVRMDLFFFLCPENVEQCAFCFFTRGWKFNWIFFPFLYFLLYIPLDIFFKVYSTIFSTCWPANYLCKKLVEFHAFVISSRLFVDVFAKARQPCQNCRRCHAKKNQQQKSVDLYLLFFSSPYIDKRRLTNLKNIIQCPGLTRKSYLFLKKRRKRGVTRFI